jgi:hypothetical protein
VSIPQRQVAAVTERGSKDGRPLGGRGVHAASHTVSIAGLNQVLVPLLVLARAASPVLGALNIEPNSSRPLRLAVVLQMGNKLVHLTCSALRASRTCLNLIIIVSTQNKWQECTYKGKDKCLGPWLQRCRQS